MDENARTITIRLDGEVSIEKLVAAFSGVEELMTSLAKEIPGESITWIVDDLDSGSAVGTWAGVTENPTHRSRLIAAFQSVADNHARGIPIPYGEEVQRAANKIASVAGGLISAIRLSTAYGEAVLAPSIPNVRPLTVAAFGSIEGKMETVSSRRRVHFNLYDTLNDTRVECAVGETFTDDLRNNWNKRVRVRGWIVRDAVTGKPRSISRIESIDVLPEPVRGSFRKARGILPVQPGDLSPEDAVRRMRDGS